MRAPPRSNRKTYFRLDLTSANLSETTNGAGSALGLFFRRPALAYSFLHHDRFRGREIRYPPKASLFGVCSERWAVLTFVPSKICYGGQQSAELCVFCFAYIFSRCTRGAHNTVDFPDFTRLRASKDVVHMDGRYHVRGAGADGKASKSSGLFEVREVQPSQSCPEALHET